MTAEVGQSLAYFVLGVAGLWMVLRLVSGGRG